MKTLIIFSIVLSAFVARAENSIRWELKDSYNEKNKLGIVSGVAMQRQIKVGDSIIPTATLSMSDIPLTEKLTEDQMAKDLSDTLEIGDWQKTKDKQFTIYQKHWPEQNRYLRLVVKVDGKRARVSLVTVRTAYVFPALIEAEFLQRYWFEQSQKKPTASVWDLFVNKAYADFRLPPNVTLPTNINIPAITLPNPSQYEPQIRAITDNVGYNTGVQIRQGAQTASNAMDRLGTQVGHGLESTGQGLNKASDAVNNLADRMSVGNIAKAALVGGLVAGSASYLSNFIIDGTISGIKKLYHSIANTLDDEKKLKIIKRYEEGLNDLKERGEELAQLESSMDSDMYALALMRNTDMSNLVAEAPANLDNVAIEKERTRRMLLLNLDKETREACMQKESVLDTMSMALRKAGFRSKEMICSSVASALNKYTSAQDALLIAKRNVQNHMLVIMSGNLDRSMESVLPIAKVDTMKNECMISVEAFEKRKRDIAASMTPDVAEKMERHIANMKNRCESTAQVQASLDPVQQLSSTLALADGNMQTSEFFFDNLVASECRAGEVKAVQTKGGNKTVCNGKPGFFAMRQDFWNKKVAQYNEMCLNQKPANPQVASSNSEGNPLPASVVNPVPAGAVAPSASAAPATAPVAGSGEVAAMPVTPQTNNKSWWQKFLTIFQGNATNMMNKQDSLYSSRGEI
jgi:hypothetical protein